MDISLVQKQIFWEDKEKNINEAENIIRSEGNSELFLFPEMSFTGFSINVGAIAEKEPYTINKIADLAMKYRVSIGFGWVRRIADAYENIYTILGAEGQLLSEYVKIHPFSYSGEDTIFKGGENVVFCNINSIPFSTFICYDLRFPELFCAVASTVHAIIIPACWPAQRAKHWKTLLRARAIENQVYIIGVNCQGSIGGAYYSGDSCVIRPDGEVAAIMSDQEGVLHYNLTDDVEIYRASFPVLRDRKIELYKKLL